MMTATLTDMEARKQELPATRIKRATEVFIQHFMNYCFLYTAPHALSELTDEEMKMVIKRAKNTTLTTAAVRKLPKRKRNAKLKCL
jgi:hypothetical protein